MSIIKQLAKILEKAHGRTYAESNKEIDVGLEVARIREESDRMNQRIRELEQAAARVLAHDWPGISEEAAAALDELSEALEQTQ